MLRSQQVLEPPGRWPALKLQELWSYRELLYMLAWRDVQVRYKQAALGGAWAVLQPLVMMAIFTLVFSRIANVATPGVPYPVFAYAGLVPWTLFASAVAGSANSIVGNANLVSKVNSPRLLIPSAPVLTWAPDFVISSVVLFVIMAIYGFAPAWTAVLLPRRHAGRDDRRLSVGGVALRAQRRVSRRAVRRAVPDAGVALCHPGGVPDDLGSRESPVARRAEPDVVGRRLLEMGAARHVGVLGRGRALAASQP